MLARARLPPKTTERPNNQLGCWLALHYRPCLQDCAFDSDLPEGVGVWPGDIEWFGYRQFKQKDRLKGQRDD
jgi:hypothetical protein